MSAGLCVSDLCVETQAGELGPSTIVGSAAFNLMIILAVCVMAIPDGQSRTIRDFGVFKVTAVSSVLAYIWLLVIVCFNTRGDSASRARAALFESVSFLSPSLGHYVKIKKKTDS